jgi:hypothetical protein
VPLSRNERLKLASVIDTCKAINEGKDLETLSNQTTLWLAIKVEQLNNEILRMKADRPKPLRDRDYGEMNP